jgi:hypothetical protein
MPLSVEPESYLKRAVWLVWHEACPTCARGPARLNADGKARVAESDLLLDRE